MLLLTRVYTRNSIVEHNKGNGVLVQSRIRYGVGEAIDVVVLHEICQKTNICAISLHISNSIVQVAHATRDRSECIDNPIPYGIVEKAAHVFLIGASNSWVVVVDFTNNVYPCGGFEGCEEFIVHFTAAVEPNAVNAVGRNKTTDP